MAFLDAQNRSPQVEMEPDRRLRVTRLYDVLNFVSKTPAQLLVEVWLDWGTPDIKFPNCLLVKQDVSGQVGDSQKPVDEPPKLVRVYEELDGDHETQVGEAGISFDQYGNKIITLEWLQLSSGTPIYETVGGTAAPMPNETAILQTEDRTNDGTLQRIKRVYTTGGVQATSENLSYDGKLSVVTIKSLNAVPTNPGGYTLVSTQIEYVNGLKVYVYGWAKGDGQISEEVTYQQSDDNGVTGVTVTTIRYLTDPSVDSNPITPPSGAATISTGYQDQDGFRLWTGVFASGQGTVIDSKDIKEGGKLVVYHRVAINDAPETPDATIGGTVTLIDQTTRLDSGYEVFDYQWAEGNGQISLKTDYQQSDDAGVTGVTITTIRYLSALSVDANPITPPGGAVLAYVSFEDNDGYRVWTAIYGEGTGTVLDERETSISGALVTYHRIAIDAPPDAPAATIGGTVTLVSVATRPADGYTIYDYRWAEGNGQTSISTQGRDDGSIVATISTLTLTATPPDNPLGSGYCTELTAEPRGGYFQNRATFVKLPVSTGYRKQVQFKMPGFAFFIGTQLTLQPPVVMDLLATTTVDFAESQVTTAPFSVNRATSFNESYVTQPTDDTASITQSQQRALMDYLSEGVSGGGSGMYNGLDCISYEYATTLSDPADLPTGATTIHVDNDPYLTDINGTKVYRRSVTVVTLP